MSASTSSTFSTFFGPRGLLANALPGYEERPAQGRLSEAVGRVLGDGGLLLAEAGTGTGKTLAYLLPAVELGRRVVVSTGTKNLQEQLLSKDLPLLARALGRDLSVAVMKGRGNYLCLLRFRSFTQAGSFRRPDEIPLFRAVEAWAPATVTGDRGEVADLPDSVDFWREISAASENCIGQSCPEFDPCWITRMRQRALEADLVVVNHHLLCADLAVKDGSYGHVIPPYDTVILDEAHLLEDVATQYFGLQVSSHRVDDLCRDAERELKAAKLDAREVRAEVEAVRDRSERVFSLLAQGQGRRLGPDWMTARMAEESGALFSRLVGLRTALLALPDRPEPLTGLATRAQVLAAELAFVLRAEDDDHVYFVETRGRGVFLKATPIDVSQRLKELLFDQVRAAVLTSATLAVDGGFEYVKARLGLEAAEELLLPSPFRFETQAIFYVPRRMPEPQSPLFVERAAEEVVSLVQQNRGRAFVLFTSHANMNRVAEQIAGRLDYPLLIQGEAPKPVLLETFKNTPGAVLLATASFWQGVDVVGDQLSCVIIDKLPFASPGDPVVAARIERLRSRGGNPFADYQVPVAILMLKQGLGRLIRSAADRGVLAVLDSRLVEKSYGQRFLASLPPARLVHDLGEVERFLGAGGRASEADPAPAPRPGGRDRPA
ncbi:MAG TPA: ATP-dependent DNA helicase [Vicinamibacteria bacterium]|nr:ATP-dependent DNA helicase [Vicinamibacteria bacterium]